MEENKHTIPKGCPHYGNCIHRKKPFKKLKKDFPYFKSSNLEELQKDVCKLCKSEWNIPRFKIKVTDWIPPLAPKKTYRKSQIEKGRVINMANTKKLTKKDYFAQLREVVKDKPELVAFIDHEVELLTRKNSGNSQTKTQKENEVVSEMLVTELEKIGKPITITDLMSTSEVVKDYVLENGNHLTNQKISAIFKQLVDNNKLVKVTDKKKSYFSVAD